MALRPTLTGGLAHQGARVRWHARHAYHLAQRGRAAVDDRVARVERTVPAGSVALTFDDGPQPGSTDRVLDVLADLGVRATFFCVGRNATAHPGLVRRIRAEGHAVGSHSLSHPHPRDTSLRALATEYAQGRAAVAEVLGEDVTLFRPPHGHLGTTSAALVRRLGLRPWLWTVDPTDWRPGISVEEVTAVASQASSGDVVLFHDWVEQPHAPSALDRSATVAALPAVVAAIRGRGLRLVTVQP